jgi:nucleotide-binding universal stress UspA family protein
VASGSPAFELLNLAEDWRAQLIVLGSLGRTAPGGFALGSVSLKVLTEARTSVRIGRASTGIRDSAQRVIIGVDGSFGSNTAVRAVANRTWPQGSEMRVVIAQDLMKGFPFSVPLPLIDKFVDEDAEEPTHADQIVTEALKQLRAGLNQSVTLSSIVDSGDPKQALVRQAEEFGANSIFMGATGFSNGMERFVFGQRCSSSGGAHPLLSRDYTCSAVSAN